MLKTIKDDFNLTKIVHSGQCFRCRLLDTPHETDLTSGAYDGKDNENNIAGKLPGTDSAAGKTSDAITIAEKPSDILSAAEFISGRHRVTVTQLSDTDFEFSCSESEFNEFWFHYFDLETDYSAIRASIADEESFLKAASEHGKGIRILRQDPFEMLITFVISQRKNIPAICKAVEAICRTAGTKIVEPPASEMQTSALNDHPLADGQPFPKGPAFDTDAPHSFYAFPDAYAMAAMTDEEWSALKLGYREKYLKRIVGSFIRGEYDLSEMAQMDDDNLRSTLTSLYGVGEKVAECVMLFGFHRLDSFPVDIWIRRALDREYPDGYGKDSYSPYNGVMQQYMYYAYRNAADFEQQES